MSSGFRGVKLGKHPPPKTVVFHDNEGGVLKEGVGGVKAEVMLRLPLAEEGEVVFLGRADAGVEVGRGDVPDGEGAFDTCEATCVTA